MTRLRRLAACSALAASSAGVPEHPAGRPAIEEVFSSYSEGALPLARWERGGLGWSVRPGRLRCEAGARSTVVPTLAPYASACSFTAVIGPERSAGSEWQTAGIAIAEDEANCWRLSLVEGPESGGRIHSVELHEMLKGRWLASIEGTTALQRTAEQGASLAWEYGREYRLRLDLTPQGITGRSEEVGSERHYSVGYAFSGDCVRIGRPTLVSASLEASYSLYGAEVGATARPRPAAKSPAYSLKPMSAIRGRATGLFRVEKIGPRWWVVDPKGHAFYAIGTDHVNYLAHWCEKLGYAPYSRNVQAEFGSEEAWAASCTGRLQASGFNTLGAGHSGSTRHRGLAHTAFLSLGTSFTAYGDIAPRTTWTGFPDVLDPLFAVISDPSGAVCALFQPQTETPDMAREDDQ